LIHMTSRHCRVCKTQSGRSIFTALILNQAVNYYECATCGYVQTEEPTWLDKAYASPINKCDTGMLQRNLSNVGIVLASLACINQREGRVVDSAGGYGILVRLLRDAGIEALWSDAYCQNLLAAGFEHTTERADLVTAFEVFEHFVNPLEEMQKLLTTAPNLLLSTLLIPKPTPAPKDWWYYGLDHGQHIGFFRLQTLEFLANKLGKHLVTDGAGYHFFTENKVFNVKWKVAIKMGSRFPSLFSRDLKSKVWSDFQEMSNPK